MTIPLIPPETEPVIDTNLFLTLNWQAFMEQVASGDLGTSWIPTFTGLTTVGTPTITGVYYQISKSVVYFRITIVPGTSTTAVNGTTFCNNFPLKFSSDSSNTAITGTSSALGANNAATNNIFTASWTALTSTITITGIGEAQ